VEFFLRIGAYNRRMDGVGLLPLEIAEALERGATVVTGNQRAARFLQRGFDRRNKELGLVSWAPASVMAWDTWMAALWHGLLIEGKASQLLLSRTQEHMVWRAVLEADKELASLRTLDSLAEMAANAWQLVSSYDGRRRLRGTIGSSDSRAFQRWAVMFERRCKVEGLLATAQLEEFLRDAVEGGLVAFPAGGFLLVGFDGMTPAQAGFVGAVEAAGVRVEEWRPEMGIVRRLLVETTDEREEISIAARWIRNFLEQTREAKIAVIVPGLETHRREIDRVFREVLAPELQPIQAANDAGPYEFSLGAALTKTPMIATALDLLRWSGGTLPLERVSGLLLSPYFAIADEERAVRAEFDAFELRKARMLRPEMSLDGLIEVVERSRRRTKLSRLLAVLRGMRSIAGRLQGMDARTNAEWAEQMRELLKAAAWGPASGETSLEFQTRRKWESALDELTTLDFDGVQIEFTEALEALERIAQQTMFAPQSHEAPVQVMGPLEAAGGTFDAVWFLRAGELNWPIQTTPSPLLPWTLQRELKMPGSDIEHDSERVRRMTERIAESAPSVIFSYAKQTANGKQRVSAMLSGLGLEKIDTTGLLSPAADRAVVELDEIEDVTPVQQLPDRVIRGGARVLQLQAACGFRAFAEQRLWATELESINPGMDARESGTVVHDALKLFWDAVRTQSELRAMTHEEREGVVDWCIMESLKKTDDSSTTDWDTAYVQIQRDRLRRLLSGWLEVEMERRLPFEVKSSEKEFKNVQVGPLHLSVRMDRVDMVEGGEVLIDYKTGNASPNDWLTDRPDAPQLPLYAILSETNQLQGVAFGLVRAGEGRAFKGYAAQDGVLPGKPARLKEAATLQAQIERWRKVLESLAREFYSGDARVRPKQYPTTCEHCGQRLLCRLDVSLLEGAEDDEEAAEELDRG